MREQTPSMARFKTDLMPGLGGNHTPGYKVEEMNECSRDTLYMTGTELGQNGSRGQQINMEPFGDGQMVANGDRIRQNMWNLLAVREKQQQQSFGGHVQHQLSVNQAQQPSPVTQQQPFVYRPEPTGKIISNESVSMFNHNYTGAAESCDQLHYSYF